MKTRSQGAASPLSDMIERRGPSRRKGSGFKREAGTRRPRSAERVAREPREASLPAPPRLRRGRQSRKTIAGVPTRRSQRLLARQAALRGPVEEAPPPASPDVAVGVQRAPRFQELQDVEVGPEQEQGVVAAIRQMVEIEPRDLLEYALQGGVRVFHMPVRNPRVEAQRGIRFCRIM